MNGLARTFSLRRPSALLAVAYGALLAYGCANAPSRPSNYREAVTAVVSPTSPDRVSLIAESGSVATVIRALGEISGKGLVLMNGIENVFVGPYEFRDLPIDEIVAQIAADTGCIVKEYPDYSFLYPASPEYEALNTLSLKTRLPPALRDVRVEIAFGTGTPLFDCFALLSLAADATIVADNALAAAHSGELSLRGVGLDTAIETLLKSARIADQSVTVETGAADVFLRSAGNPAQGVALLNGEALTDELQAVLDRPVRLRLPPTGSVPGHLEASRGAQTLSSVLPDLSDQWGIPVHAEENVLGLPVNPMVMNGVPLKRALELLIGQWLAPGFGYELGRGGVVIKYAGSSSPR